MERLLFIMRVQDGAEAEYERRHREVWPDLQADLHAAGWRNYSLFRRGLTVYGYAECHPDVASAQAAMASSKANDEWQVWFRDVLAEVLGDDGNLVVAEQMWHLDEDLAVARLSGR